MIKKFVLTSILWMLMIGVSFAGAILNNPMFSATDDDGDPLTGGLLYSYTEGTTTAKALYTDKACTIADTNPVVLDSRGEAEIYGTTGGYKLVLRTSADVTIWTIDNIDISAPVASYLYFPDSSQADQGAATAGGALTYKDFVDSIGATKKATIVLVHTGAANTTPYIFSTTETSTSNISVDIQNGAVITDDASNASLTINGKIRALPEQQIFDWGNGTGEILGLNKAYTMWFGNDTAAIQTASDAIEEGGEIIFPSSTIAQTSAVTFTTGCILTGKNTIIQTVDDYVDAWYITGDDTTMSGFTFQPTGARTRFRTCVKINADNCKVIDCKFLGNGKVVGEYGRGTGLTFGSDITNPDNLTIDKCYFKDFEAMINIATSTNVLITNSYFTGGIDPTYAAANYGGSYMGDAIKLDTPTAYDSNQGASVFDNDYTAATYVTVTNNKFYEVNRDALDAFQGGTNIVFSNNIVSGSRMDTCLDIKLFYAGVTNTGNSIPTYRQSRNVSIIGNQFVDAQCTNWNINISSNFTDTDTSPVASLDDDNVIYSININGNLFENPKNPVVSINNSSGVMFADNIVRNFEAGSNDEFVIIMKSLELSTPTMKRFSFSDNQITIVDAEPNLGFIKLLDDTEGVQGMIVSDNIYYGGEDDVFMSMGTSTQIDNLQIVGNIMRGPTTASWASNFLNLREVSNSNIVNNQMHYCNVEAINIVGAEYLNITGNIIRAAGQSTADKDIRIDDGTTVATSNYIYIHHNILEDNGGSLPGFTNNASGTRIVATELGVEATTAQLADATHAINTTAAKVLGYQVFNTDTGLYVYAIGNADADDWNYGFGGIAHSPA